MITGYDAVFAVAIKPGPQIAVFLDKLAKRWPDMIVQAKSDVGSTEFRRWADGTIAIPAIEGEVLIAKDPEMNDQWDEFGYEIPDLTEGPIYITYEPCRVREFTATVRNDPYKRNREHNFQFDPYDIIFAGRGLSLVTIVTTEFNEKFANLVYELFVSAASELE